ncbi:hypothetical protein B0H21DRAFT_752445 [Amylocystis lapponica]|nr:hypothetical protein B0H21DRAFT_752445 [Amylocystis lapponica]
MYARKPGSLRRAESLRSELSAHEDSSKHVPALHPSLMPTRFISSGSATPTSNAYAYVPTEPSTPVAHSPQLLPSPLPIVAPPPFELIPREPLSDEDAAERRLRILLVKEKLEREADGLSCDDDVCLDAQEQENVVMWTPGDGGDDVDEEGNSCVGACFDADGSISDSESGMFEDGASDGDLKSQDSGRDEHHEETRESKFSKTPELALGLEDDFRRKVVEWIIDVLPPVIPTKRHFCAHLHDQLTTSDETRFHAAHVFTRYLLRLGRSPASSPGVAKPSKSDLEQEGQKALIWDIALACVALCVKFHRDALFPLYIILTNEFLALAPHALTDEDLETAQRDVFEALSFSLGSTTPAAFMQELWHALPSLRALLSFDDGWAVAQAEAWAVLLEALLEPDVFRFPVSLLTAAALLDGVEEAVIRKRSVQARGVARNDPVRIRKGAVRASKTVVLDVLEVLGYVEEDLACCRRWLHSGR